MSTHEDIRNDVLETVTRCQDFYTAKCGGHSPTLQPIYAPVSRKRVPSPTKCNGKADINIRYERRLGVAVLATLADAWFCIMNPELCIEEESGDPILVPYPGTAPVTY